MLTIHGAEPPEPVPAPLQGGIDGNTEAEGAEGEGEAEEGEEAGECQRTRRLSARNRERLHSQSRASITKLTRRGAPMLRLFCTAQGERIVAAEVHNADAEIPSGVELLDNPELSEDYGASDGLTCAAKNGLIVPMGQVQVHIEAEHPNGTLAVAPVLVRPLGEA